MKCANCGKYVDRHNLKDSKNCLNLCSNFIIKFGHFIKENGVKNK